MWESIPTSIAAHSGAIHINTLDYIDIQAYEVIGSIKG